MARRTVESELRQVLLLHAGAVSTDQDFSAYRNDPGGFARKVCGMRLTLEQEEILRSVVDNDRVTVRSGRRIGKTYLAALVALWFICTRGPRALVVLTAPRLTSVQEIIWEALTYIYLHAKVPLGGKLAHLAATGLQFEDGRRIKGITASNAESFQGLASPELLFICDEASGIADYIFTALEGNLASHGAKLFMISNPTRTDGYFYRSHKNPSFKKFHLSSLCSPNIVHGKLQKGFEGMASLEWLEHCKRDWGADSPNYHIHVLGEFVEGLEGYLFPPAILQASNFAWPDMPAMGPLTIGCDPAGDGSDGDESAFVCRRGLKIVWSHTNRGMSAEAHLIEILGLIGTHRGDSWEKPRVVLDREGPIGAKVYAALLGYLQNHKDAFVLIGISGSKNARRMADRCRRMRDELWYSLVDAFKAGLAIPPSSKLEGDLASIRFDKLVDGKATIIPKQEIRKQLGRSPDLGDALSLAAYDAPSWVDEEPQLPEESREPAPTRTSTELYEDLLTANDPYSLLEGVQGRRNPWGGEKK